MESKSEIVKVRQAAQGMELAQFELTLTKYLGQLQLPVDGILVTVDQRVTVLNNIEQVIVRIDAPDRQQSLYLSKFIASVGAGLFDAALNYLWDETILQIRKRVIQYDIDYFFDNAVAGERRKRLKGEDDLINIGDYELIKGSKEIGLVSEIGFKHLEYINYMRNWVSAAHPNHNSITGLQLVGWLETCVNEVISLPISNITIEIKKLLSDVKSTMLTDDAIQDISTFFANLLQDQVNNLASGFYGIYTKTTTDSHSRLNINRLLPQLWGRVDEDVKASFGLKYGYYAANNFSVEKNLSREFLQIVSGESYIPEELKIPEIDAAIESLTAAHRGFNNFYNEPTFATQLQRIVGESQRLPRALNRKYVYAIVEAYLTNGNGVAKNAEPIYLQLLSGLNSDQANIAVLSFIDTSISSRLQLALCAEKFRSVIEIVSPIVTSPAVRELVSLINEYAHRLDGMKADVQIRAKVENLKVLLK